VSIGPEAPAENEATGRVWGRVIPTPASCHRAPRFTEAGVDHWLRTLKKRATKDEWELISDVTFHDLRHDFVHRARAAGWTVEEVAYYLGHTTKKGTPAIQTTVEPSAPALHELLHTAKQRCRQ
jgi:integrase